MSKLNISKMMEHPTPQSVQEIEDWIAKHPGQNQEALYSAVGMTWNFLASMIEEHQRSGGDAVSDGS